MPTEDLHDIIADSVTDAELPEDPVDDSSEPEGGTTGDSEIVEPEASGEAEEGVSDASATEVQSPASKPVEEPAKPADDFDKKFGLTAQSSSGRENRIPYSRVKKITEKAAKDAVKDAQASWTKGLETSHVPAQQFQQLTAKVQDYEGRLAQVAEFERIMMNDPAQFLKMLVALPPYAAIFNNPQMPQPGAQGGSQQAPQPVSDEMPQPDQTLTDGSKVYSMDGLKSLLNWQSKQVEDRVTRQVEQRYAPLENDYRQYQHVQSVIPQVQQQIADARTWPLFNENEAEIVTALQQNPNWNLERAYQHAVLPKIQANREQMRAELLKEVKSAPKATSTPTSGVKATPARAQSGNRSLEEVIRDSIQVLK